MRELERPSLKSKFSFLYMIVTLQTVNKNDSLMLCMCYDTKSIYFQVYFIFIFCTPDKKELTSVFFASCTKGDLQIMIKRSPFHIQKRITAHEKIMLIQEYCYV